jgi:hypothetical protein
MPPQSHALTARHPGCVHVIRTQCDVGESYDRTKVGGPPSWSPFTAIWDTGATGCVITDAVVKKCNLAPIGMTKVSGVHGIQDAEVYVVSLKLPNDVAFATVEVTKGELAGAEVLIGMNVITTGDFSITNLNGNTVFSFRFPSQHEIDYVLDLQQNRQPQNIPGPQNRAARRAKKR